MRSISLRRLASLAQLLSPLLLMTAMLGCGAGPTQPTPSSDLSDRGSEPLISATGKVLPRQWAELGFEMSGIVEAVQVSESDVVSRDQLLATLDAADLEAALAEAQAGLAVAQRRAELARAVVREPVVTRARAALELAREQQREAELEAQVVCIQGDGALASVQVYQALLRQAAAGPTANELELARLRVEQAKAELYGLQGRRDALGGLRGGSTYEVGSFEAAEGQVFAAEAGVQIAEVQQRITASGARSENVAVAKARVAEAEAALPVARGQCERAQQGVLSAQQRVELAEAELAVAQLGASAEELAVADAQVRQAEASLERAHQAWAKTELRAPFAGTIADLDLRVGEWVLTGQPRIFLGDLSDLYVETTDLDEIDVARVVPGAAVRLTFDALPDVELSGIVERVALKAGSALGGTAYTVTIAPLEKHPRLRWGMTAFVDIEVK